MSLVLLGILNSQAAAAGGAGAFDLLETITTSTTTANVTFSGLGSYTDYKHLELRMTARSDQSSTYLNTYDMTFNGDTSASYTYHTLYGAGSGGWTYSSSVDNDKIQFINGIAGNSVVSSTYIPLRLFIQDFANTSKAKSIQGYWGGMSEGYEYNIHLHGSLFKKTDAITSITLDAGNYNFVSNCRFSLYGVK